jgi:CopG family nickel-responsive transcriptional regulator
MAAKLVRFGVAMEDALLESFDALVLERGGTRSEVLRDLVRKELARSEIEHGAMAVGALTLVYDHHVRELTERLTEIQHDLGDAVRSTMHVHLSHDLCLEVIVMRGSARVLQQVSDRILATKGVVQGGLELIAERVLGSGHGHRH